MIRKLAILFAVVGIFAITQPANAGIVFWQTTNDNSSSAFGGDGPTYNRSIGNFVTMQESYMVCSVNYKLYRSGVADAGVSAVLTIYQSDSSIFPEYGTIVAIARVLESDLPAYPGAGPWTTYTQFNFDLAKGDGSGCKLLQDNVSYFFKLTRDVYKAGSNPLQVRDRTTDQYTYSNEMSQIGGSWASAYPREVIMQIDGRHVGATAEEMGLLGTLFIPATSTIARLNGLSGDFNSRVPMGYYYALRDQALLLSTSTPSDFEWYFYMEGSETLLPYPTTTINITDRFDEIPQNLKDWAKGGALAYMMIVFWRYVLDVKDDLFKKV